MAQSIWKLVDKKTTYDAIATKDSNALYFVQDVAQIYRGEKLFTESHVVVDEFPATGIAQGKIYIKTSTLEGKIYNGTSWSRVIQPAITALTDGQTDDGVATAEAVKAYTGAKLTDFATNNTAFAKDVTYDTTKKALNITRNGSTESVVLADQLVSANYDSSTGVLSFVNGAGAVSSVSLPLEQFVKSGSYDSATEQIILVMQDNTEIKIPAQDLVNVYEFTNTDTATFDTSVPSQVKVNVKISGKAGNTLQALTATDSGLYVAPVDISGKLDVVTGTAGNIIVAKANGQVETSLFKAGGSTISATPDANTLITEVAVDAIRTVLITSINGRVAKTDIATTIGTSASALDTKVASQKAVASAIEDLATVYVAKSDVVTGAINASSPSTTKVVSEASLVSSISWEVITAN